MKKKMAKDIELKDEMDNINDGMYDDSMDAVELDEEKTNVFDKKNKNMLELYALTGKSKIKGIKEYIFDLFESGQKFLVFAHHQDVMNEIETHVQNKCKTKYIRIDGNTSTDKRQLLVDKFQNEEGIRIAILSITAAGTGLTLTAATSVVFAELYWSPSSLLQCEDRAHRISQKSVVTVIYLLGKNSLDDRMWPMLKKKMKVISKTLSGKQLKMEVEQSTDHFIKNNMENHGDNHNNYCFDGSGGKQRTITSMLTPVSKAKKT